MRAFIEDIEELTEDNHDYRRVIFTGKQLQLVLMSIPPGEDLGEEVHPETDQFFRVEEGKGQIFIEGNVADIESDFGIIVPAGTRHNIKNTGFKALKLYTLYAPPQHPDGTIQHSRSDAEMSAT